VDRSELDGPILDHRRLVVTSDEPDGTEPDGSHPDKAPPRVAPVIVGVATVGTLAAVATCLGWSGRGTSPVAVTGGLSTAWLAVLLLAITALAEFTSVQLRHGDQNEALTLLEAAMVADVLLLPPAVATVVAISGLAIASAVARRNVMKSVFNLGAHATGTALLVTLVSAAAPAHAGLSAAVVGALLAGVLCFGAINLGLLSWVLAVATGVPARQTIMESYRLSLMMAVGTCGIGAVAVAVAVHAPVLLPFTLLPAAALTFAYRAAAQEASERERSSKLVALTQVLAGRLVADDLLLSFTGLLREAFSGTSARVVLEGDLEGREESPGAVVVAEDDGVTHGELTAFDAALLARAGGVPELISEGLPAGWGRTFLAPLEADGRRLGVLVLVGNGNQLKARDLAVLSPLVSALAVALRGADHLTRLVEETDKLQAVVDHSSDGILVVDADSRVLVWSPSMHALSGLPPSLAIGRRLPQLLRCRLVETEAQGNDGAVTAPDDSTERPSLLDVATLGLTAEKPRRTIELALIRPDGEARWVRMSHNAVFAAAANDAVIATDAGDHATTLEAGSLAQDVVLVYDVTRERQVERLKADFIATVSHELRTPITPIKGYVELLRRRGDEMPAERRREMLDTVSDRVSHLTRLVEDLLLASGVSAPSAAVVMQTVDLATLTRRAVDDFPGESIRLTTRTPLEPVVVSADPTRVIQVLANLISNGLKYSPAESPVEITCSIDAEARTASVRVRDSGRGIPTDQLDRVFEKFHRVEDPLRMTTSGTGLGLFIARRLAGAMDGALAVESTLGRGTTFVFTLPLAPVGTELPTPAHRPGSPFGLPGQRGRFRRRHDDPPDDNAGIPLDAAIEVAVTETVNDPGAAANPTEPVDTQAEPVPRT
jgi:signal transduction histidine kinase